MQLKRFFISALCMVGFLLFCGCNAETTKYEDQFNSTQNAGEFSSLTDRQKQILEQMELPTDYELLDYTQQRAIKRIEIMLRYLEEKYGAEFSYAGYVPAGVMESEHLTAYPTADGSGDGANLVTVKPDGDTFKDNYASKEIREYYESLCTDFVRNYFQSEQAKVVVYGFSTSMKSSDEITDECFHYKIGTSTLVFVSDTICDEEQMKAFAEAMKLWFEEHEIISDSRVSLIRDDDVTGITRDRIADYYSNKKLNLNGDYDIIIYGDEEMRNQIVPNSRGGT